MRFSTIAAHVGLGRDAQTGAVSVPIYQTATFRHPALGQSTGFDYSRSENPTREALEDGLARMEGAAAGFALSSGMAAITTLLLLFRSGDHLVATEDMYGGTYRLLEQCFARFGLTCTYVDTSDASAVRAAMRPETQAVLVESLTNPVLRVADIGSLAALCAERGTRLIVDNTFLTPYLLRPIELGADVALYSGTKYIAGHNDTVCGLIAVKDPELAERVSMLQNAAGAILAPQDSWLTIRGLKTLPIRMDRQQANAQQIAEWLLRHPLVRRVHYPGLPEHPGHETLKRQASGFGAVVSFEVATPELVPQVLAGTRLISFAESLGGVESLITFPAVQTHADLDPDTRARLGISDVLLRLSVGIEDVGDLIEDLERAIATAAA